MACLKIVLLVALAIFAVGMFATDTNAGWTAAAIAAGIFGLVLVAGASGSDAGGLQSTPTRLSLSGTHYDAGGGDGLPTKEAFAHFIRYYNPATGLYDTRTEYNPAWKVLSNGSQPTSYDYNHFYGEYWEARDRIEDARRAEDGRPALVIKTVADYDAEFTYNQFLDNQTPKDNNND